MAAITAAFEAIARYRELVLQHLFDHGDDGGPFLNFTFGTTQPRELWRVIQKDVYEDAQLAGHMRRASMAMCSSEQGWDQYLLLFHVDTTLALDGPTELE